VAVLPEGKDPDDLIKAEPETWQRLTDNAMPIVDYTINMAATSIRKKDIAIIVEGYMDVITAHQNGFDNVVASMGTSITDKQVALLKKLSRNLVLALDADTAGEEAMLRCVGLENTLESEIKVAVLPESGCSARRQRPG